MEEAEYKEKYAHLVAAFCDEAFEKELKEVRDELVKLIEKLLEGAEKHEPRLKNYFSIESRIKGIDSFKEKLNRKSYIRDLEITEDTTENQIFIKSHLTDLIGIRIDCYFMRTEKFLYDFFERNFNEPDSLDNVIFDFTENKEQANGHIIYKFSGLYKNEYHFEVQIKSAIHNVWGEVEHKTIYKNPYYNGLIESKKNIVETLYNIFKTSDNQLQLLFTMEEKEEQLLNSLFFCYSEDQVEAMCGTSILGNHYVRYFSIFKDNSLLKQYILCHLSGKEYERITYTATDSELTKSVRNRVLDEVDTYKLSCLFNIGNVLYSYASIEDFAYHLVSVFVHDEQDEFDDERKENFCDDVEDEETNQSQTTDDPVELYVVQIKAYFKDANKKNGNE